MSYISVIYTFIFIMINLNLVAQNKYLKKNIEAYYLDNCENNNLNIDKDSITIYFESGFSEQTEVYINNKLVLKEKLEQYKSIGSTNKNWTYNFIKYGKYPSLKVYLLKSKYTLNVVLNCKYKFLFINNMKDKWSLIYRNTPIIRE
jgi:hypothetical protein